jgi:hypothetical protein
MANSGLRLDPSSQTVVKNLFGQVTVTDDVSESNDKKAPALHV